MTPEMEADFDRLYFDLDDEPREIQEQRIAELECAKPALATKLKKLLWPNATAADSNPLARLRDEVYGRIAKQLRGAVPPKIDGYDIPDDNPNNPQQRQPLGQGGMGVVWRAHERLFERDLAIKVINPEFADDAKAKEEFLREAHLMAQLQHPHIPPVHNLGRLDDGRPFFVMKLVRGKTLFKILADQASNEPTEIRSCSVSPPETTNPKDQVTSKGEAALSQQHLLAIFKDVCDAVGYVHAKAIMHRDLKPLNIMVGAHDEVQVMDWGLARHIAQPDPNASVRGHMRSGNSATDTDEPVATGPGEFKGTPAYMAPEQARGETDLDQRVDVFSLGAALCELLTGKPAYTGNERAEILDKAQRADLADAHARLDQCGADAELIALAKRCLCAKRWERPGNAAEIAGVLTKYEADKQERLRAAELETVRSEEERKRLKMERAAAAALADEAAARADEEKKRRLVEQAKFALERKRRRTSLALVIAVFALLSGAVAVWVYLDRKETAARIANENRVVLTLAKLKELHESANKSPSDEITRAKLALAAWQKCLLTVEEAEGICDPSQLGSGLREQIQMYREETETGIENLKYKITLLEGELDFLRILRRARALTSLAQLRMELGDTIALSSAAREYLKAYMSVGINFAKDDPEEIVKKIINKATDSVRPEMIWV